MSNYRFFVMRVPLILLFIFICVSRSYGFEIFYPVEKDVKTNYDYALFVGRARNSEVISINSTRIFTASNGAFAHSVKLKEGENRVVIRSNYSTKVYNVIKQIPKLQQIPEAKEFKVRPAKVAFDEIPLRSMPEDNGFNILSYLYKDTTLLINGECGAYYRVYLSKDKTAWIAKNDVNILSLPETVPAKFINMNSEKFKNATVQTIAFTKNLPYTVEDKDNEILFKIYNPELSDTSVYTLNIPKPEKYFYYVTLKDGFYTFKVCELPKNIEECTIIIDAGHGGTQSGALGCLGDKEKNINLKIALELQKILKEKGANVVMTRECDGTIFLKDRIKIGRENKANIYLSIHLNSIGNVSFNKYKHTGTSTYYFNKNSEALAKLLEKTISRSAGTSKNGVKSASFAVIRPAEYIGVLIEAAYMINPSDTLLYTKEDFARNTANGIAEGLLEFIEK